MKFLLDENVPKSIQLILQEKGYSTITLNELNKRGISNGEVAELSLERDAIIITFDSDFLSLKKNLEKKIRAIYIKLHPRNPKIARTLLDKHLDSCLSKLEKPHIIILSQKGISIK